MQQDAEIQYSNVQFLLPQVIAIMWNWEESTVLLSRHISLKGEDGGKTYA
jgi:hypothetical protein